MWDTCTIWTELFDAIKKEKKNSTLQWRIEEHKVCFTCPRATPLCLVYAVKSTITLGCWGRGGLYSCSSSSVMRLYLWHVFPSSHRLCPSLCTTHGTGEIFSTLASLSLNLLWKWGWTVLTKGEVWAEELEWVFKLPHQIISVSHWDKHSLEVHVLFIKSMDLSLKQVKLMEFGENFVFINVSASDDKHPSALRSVCLYAKFGPKFWDCFCSYYLWIISS